MKTKMQPDVVKLFECQASISNRSQFLVRFQDKSYFGVYDQVNGDDEYGDGDKDEDVNQDSNDDICDNDVVAWKINMMQAKSSDDNDQIDDQVDADEDKDVDKDVNQDNNDDIRNNDVVAWKTNMMHNVDEHKDEDSNQVNNNGDIRDNYVVAWKTNMMQARHHI